MSTMRDHVPRPLAVVVGVVVGLIGVAQVNAAIEALWGSDVLTLYTGVCAIFAAATILAWATKP